MVLNPNITIGITTYNRKSILKMMAKSYHESNLFGANLHVRIYDDKSSEFNKDFLKDLFPEASTIVVNEVNKKSDLNILSMYQDFLTTDDDYFFNADSDLIFDTGWLQYILDNFDKTDGILSVFNTLNHSVVAEDGLFLQKKDIGSAGTFFSRERVQQIVSFSNASDNLLLDWGFCKKFIDMGVRILCSKRSYVQHIGLNGQNSLSCMADFGENFCVDTITNGQIINDILLSVCKESYEASQNFLKNKVDLILRDRNESVAASYEYTLGKLLLFPVRKLVHFIRMLKRIGK